MASNKRALYQAYRGVRATLERVPILRSAISSSVHIKDTLLDAHKAEKTHLEDFYSEEDPFGFERPEETIRFERGLQMLDAVRGSGRFARVFEAGCAEGKFTAMLGPRCERVLAVDLSERALNRAQCRCSAFGNIEFAIWNMRHDALPGTFDVITAVGVVEYIHRPATIGIIRDRMVAALNPGGYLLVGTTLSNVEGTWLGRKLMRGTMINRFFEAHAQLETVSRATDQCAMAFEHVLLRKRR